MFVTVIDSNKEVHNIKYIRHEYPNLMELIVNTYYSEIGECKSKGLCGTCIVEAVDCFIKIDKSKQEVETLLANNAADKKYRLACQIELSEAINGAVFKVRDHKYN